MRGAKPAAPLARVLLRKLFFAYVGFVVVVACITFVKEYRDARRNVITTLQALASTFAPSAETAIWDYQTEIIKSIANGIGTHPMVLRVEINGDNGNLKAAWASPSGQVSTPELSVTRILYHQENGHTKELGHLMIASSDDVVYEHLKSTLLSIAVIASAQFVFLGLVLWGLARLLVVRPLKRFSAEVNALSAAGLNHPIDLKHRQVAEIVTLETGFNQLITQLAHSHAEVAEHNTLLEQRVLERTQEVEQKEAGLRNILDATQAGTWEWNVQTGAVTVNERWMGMLGYTQADLAPINIETWQSLCHPLDLTHAGELLNKHFAGEIDFYDCELRMRHKLGYWVWVLARGRLISRTPEGEPEWMAGTHLDISESKRLFQQLADIRTALDEHAQVSITDANGTITYANDKFCELSGYPRENLLGRTHRVVNSGYHPREFFEHLWATVTRGFTWKGQIKNRCQDGSFYWVDTTISPILDSIGRPVQYIAIRYDITEQKLNDEKLLAAKEEAEAASRAKSEFLANMSHEIRTPMNGILGMLKLLEYTDLNARQLDYAKKAQSATGALLGIINDILDFSKVEAGKLELDCHPFALGNVMRDLSVILSANMSSNKVEVFFSLDPAIPPVLIGDDLRLQQILLNLSSNALKFTDEGEVAVSIRVLKRDAERVGLEFSVQDTGIGIPADKLEAIFEGFHQAESSTSRRFGGTGLGLAISKRLLNLMGGDLQVESEFGRGSRFSFCIELGIAANTTITVPALPMAMHESEPLHVLIVDDNAHAREVLTVLCTSLGWQVQSVDSGEAALALLPCAEPRPFDIVFVDWFMGGIDGWDTTRRIRQLKLQGKPPIVIMLTTSGQELFAQKSKRERDLLDGYLIKPITSSMLHDAAFEALSIRSGHISKTEPEAAQRLAGLRILVVEDNPLNQQVAQGLLIQNGAVVEIAGGGNEGVTKAVSTHPPFDVVLMDLQMPDIDGLEATRQIRAHPDLVEMPIIAMTANAMESDREECLAVGMVDHVSKPVDVEELTTAILRHVKRARPVVTAELTRVEGEFLADIDVENAIKRLGGNRPFYDKVVASFCVDALVFMDDLKEDLKKNQLSDAIRSAHTFKGLAHTVGAVGLAHVLTDLENEFKRVQTVELSQAALTEPINREKLDALLPGLHEKLRATLHELSPHPASSSLAMTETIRVLKEAEKADLVAILLTLAELLQAHNMRSLMVYADIQARFGPALGVEKLKSLELAINQLDFGQAQKECQGLLAGLQ